MGEQKKAKDREKILDYEWDKPIIQVNTMPLKIVDFRPLSRS